MIEDGVDGFFEVTTDWRYGYVSEARDWLVTPVS